MQKMNKKKLVVAALTALAVLAIAGVAFALNNSSGSTTGAELYDLIVNDFIKGPIGSAAGVGFIVVGAVMAVMGKISGAIWPLIGGGTLALADTLADSLGMLF